MKSYRTIFASILLFLFMMNAYAGNSTVRIDGQQAKNIYDMLTGSAVQNEGAAGHFYRHGKNVLCRYINADIDDSKGKIIPSNDPRRYACSIKFDKNGLASPGETP